ncbi:ribosomal S6, mitochondrial-like [Octopus vulgaris]|uniref:Small ribosomal subunit protein bS6m n=1 Tax=Octopus vulgaris TaxID=6645 RepID=A0AA36B481_OCTVU|nr:ribosomal S6, mitochondrial-like [Octopus vulgaris]
MPGYQLFLIMRSALNRSQLHSTVRRSCEAIIERKGIVRSLENMGQQQLPYIMRKHQQIHHEGRYFLINFDSPTDKIVDLSEYLQRDVDIVRPGIILKKEEHLRPCEYGPCVFGELPNPDHEKRVWRTRVLKRLKISRKRNDPPAALN